MLYTAGMTLMLAEYAIERDYSFSIGKYHVGFVDADQTFEGDVTLMQLGPLREFHHVPISATQGWLIVALILVGLLTSISSLGLRFQRRRAQWSIARIPDTFLGIHYCRSFESGLLEMAAHRVMLTASKCTFVPVAQSGIKPQIP
jgi:hypothetical protein